MKSTFNRAFPLPAMHAMASVLLMIGCLCCAMPCHAQTHLSKTQLEERLGYLESVPDFTASIPLSQNALMKLVLELRYWGAFPEAYRGKGKIERADAYITREMARRFIRELVGQDLQIWKSTNDEVLGNNLGWIYNTGNTMYRPPYVRIIGRKSTGERLMNVQFLLWDNPGNIARDRPPVKLGTGTAVLECRGRVWTVTRWKVSRLRHKDEGTGDGSTAKAPGVTRIAKGREIASRLITLVKRNDWKAVGNLYSGSGESDFLGHCKRLRKRFNTFRVSTNNLIQPEDQATVLIGLRAPDGWMPTLTIDVRRNKIVGIDTEDD